MNATEKILAQLDILDRLNRLTDSASLTTSEAAIFLRSSVSALEALRTKGTGPRYIQAGGKGAGVNQKCLYQKLDLLAWQEQNKISSTLEAAIRNGQMFVSLHDVVSEEAFWIDERGQVVGMVEQTPIGVVLDRLGVFEIVWLPVIDAVALPWVDVDTHKSLAFQVTAVLKQQSSRVAAGVESSEISSQMGEGG